MSKKLVKLLFILIIVSGLFYAGDCLYTDLQTISAVSLGLYGLLIITLIIALGFEFVNGFHDSANAVATVIYTYSLTPNVAVMWSGICNFLGVMLSSGAVAYGIIALLPIDLILQMGNHTSFAMIFALLLSAIVWNLGTWWLGLPASSSHALIGSIVGVGIAYQWLNHHTAGQSTNWHQLINVLESLLFSPILGFILAGGLLLLAKRLLRQKSWYQTPQNQQPPPWPIRLLLILTCTTVSFAHGSNDGQKGMGLIMLILIGVVPMAYALNHHLPENHLTQLQQNGQAVQHIIQPVAAPAAMPPDVIQTTVLDLIDHKQGSALQLNALTQLIGQVNQQLSQKHSLHELSAAQTGQMRTDLYLINTSLTLIRKNQLQHHRPLTQTEQTQLAHYQESIEKTTQFIPGWVKVMVALALGLGTLVGWKRVVVTLGEKIGKTQLTYAQGASAQLAATALILSADRLGLPVSTTHVLSSGIAGTMAANRSGLQARTLYQLIMAWVLTLPVCILLSGGLFWLLSLYI
ncbi:inorganic phosphate transporter [Neisseriaceae bacterium ESL0693]|nr:inorganic phosphate transporter [Neisseriaceae bacterium ESL0693]